MQKAPQRFAIVVLGLLGDAGIRCPIEAVIRPRIHVELDVHPGAAQSLGEPRRLFAHCNRVAEEDHRLVALGGRGIDLGAALPVRDQAVEPDARRERRFPLPLPCSI